MGYILFLSLSKHLFCLPKLRRFRQSLGHRESDDQTIPGEDRFHLVTLQKIFLLGLQRLGLELLLIFRPALD